MSSITLTIKQIQAAIFDYISSNLTVETTVEWSGHTVDKETINDWLEVVVSGFLRPPQRRNSLDFRRGLITVVAHAKRGTNIYRIMDLSKDVTDVLKHAEIPILDFSEDGDPRLGGIRVNEPQRFDRTPEANESKRSNVRVFELQFPAYAQADST